MVQYAFPPRPVFPTPGRKLGKLTVFRPLVCYGGSVCMYAPIVHTDSFFSGWMRMSLHSLSEIIIGSSLQVLEYLLQLKNEFQCAG